LLGLDREQECQEILAELQKRGFLEPEAESLKEQLALRAQVEESGGTTQARAALEADPNNVALQITLAEALSVDKQYGEACEMLLAVIAADSTEIRDRAKDAMVVILSAMGQKSQQAGEFRRRLATAFY
jgi:putative thioredoxin